MREKNAKYKPDPNKLKHCTQCETEKPETEFNKQRTICKCCHNANRVKKYNTDANTQNRIRAESRAHKAKKTKARQADRAQRLAQLEMEIGTENTICKYCEEVTPKTNFRHNRRRCKDCERDEPYSKFTRNIRSDIYARLIRPKEYHTIEYLGCTYRDFIEWMQFVNPDYTLENHGSEWHIDHVIPISRFDTMNDAKNDVFVAWNWRNTTPLLKYDNLAKNNKIIKQQINDHLTKLQEYHQYKKMELPKTFIELFAKHLDAGNP